MMMSKPTTTEAVGCEAWIVGRRCTLYAARPTPLAVVLGAWLLCWLAFALLLYRYGTPIPFCDEWYLTPVATGHTPLSFEWLWLPQNEHRAPLNRLEVMGLGWLAGWDLRLARHVHVALLAMGSLALIFAVRSVRGRSVLGDAFFPLVVLTPCQFETLFLYAYGYAMPLAIFCLGLSALMTRWPLRSLTKLFLYLVMALVISLSGGPAGNAWAIGLCGAILPGWMHSTGRTWRRISLAGAATVVITSAFLIVLIPKVPHHDVYRSDSLQTTVLATGRAAMSWLGGAVLRKTYPWVTLAVVIPMVILAAYVVRDCLQLRRGAGLASMQVGSWADIAMVLGASLSVAGMIGYARAYFPSSWSSRYATLVLPIGVVCYLLMVRLRGPRFIPTTLALLAAASNCGNWPEAIRQARFWHAPAGELVHALRRAEEPLTSLAQRYAGAVGYGYSPSELLVHLVHLRAAGLSVFHPSRQIRKPDQSGQPLLWEAECGRHNESFREVVDCHATNNQALEAVAIAGSPATACFDLDINAAGTYLLCCRVSAPAAGQILKVQADDGVIAEQVVPVAADYIPLCPAGLLDLGAGRHTLTITMSGPGARLDVLELMPQATQLASQ